MIFNNSLSQFDCVLMLTWSDWATEMRSNRYHYATRFARHLPVLFVQPDSEDGNLYIEKVDDHAIWIVHVGKTYCDVVFENLGKSLGHFKLKKPLLWIYNGFFAEVAGRISSELKIYHATEDYFSSDFNGSNDVANSVRQTLKICDGLVAVSEGVLESYQTRGSSTLPAIVLTNGVDFDFWKFESPKIQKKSSKPVAVYQGGISRKINFALLADLVARRSDWTFRFYGKIFECEQEASALFTQPNVEYKGSLSVENLREEMKEANAGLIPFVENDWITKRSFPLKAYEYLAAGIPVISTPIDALKKNSTPVIWARSSDEFSVGLNEALALSHNIEDRTKLSEVARSQDYEIKFRELLVFIANLLKKSQMRPSSFESRYRWLHITSTSLNNFNSQISDEHRSWMTLLFDDESDLPLELVRLFDAIYIDPSIGLSATLKSTLDTWLKNFAGAKLFGPLSSESLKEAEYRIRRPHKELTRPTWQPIVIEEPGSDPRVFLYKEKDMILSATRKLLISDTPSGISSDTLHFSFRRCGLRDAVRLLITASVVLINAIKRYVRRKLIFK